MQEAQRALAQRAAVPRFMVLQMKQGEAAREVWTIAAGQDMTPEAIMSPAAYVHISRQIRKGAHIEVLSYDGTWYAHLLVRGVRDGEVQVGMLQFVQFDDMPERDVADYDIEAVGDGVWRVVRKADKHIMVNGLGSRLQCLQWLERPAPSA